MVRQPHPSDGNDEAWAVVAPSLTFMTEDAPQRDHSLREVVNGLCWIVRTGVETLQCNVSTHRSATMLHRLAAHPALAEGRGRCDARPRSAHAGA